MLFSHITSTLNGGSLGYWVASCCHQSPRLLVSFWTTVLSKWLPCSNSPLIQDGDQLISYHDQAADKKTEQNEGFAFTAFPEISSNILPAPHWQELSHMTISSWKDPGICGPFAKHIAAPNNVRFCDEGEGGEWMLGSTSEVSATLLFNPTILLVQMTF